MSKKRLNISINQLTTLSTLQRLQSIKHELLDTINCKKKNHSIEAVYRSKATKLYQDKLKHVFHPLKMQQRPAILNFENYLDEYVQQSNQLKFVVQNDQPYTNQTIQKMTKADVFDVLLTLDVEKICQLTSMKPQKKQPYLTLTQIEQQKHFPVKKHPNIKKNSSGYKSRHPQSPINISPFSSKDILQSPKSPLKRSQFSYDKQSSYGSSKLSLKKYKKSQLQPQAHFTPNNIIDRLNQINNTNQDHQSFKMPKSTLKTILQSNHANQILTTYLDLPQILSTQKIANTLNTIYQATSQQKLMIAFLTYDINKDGFICEQDLFQVSKNIDHTSLLNSDVHRITQFCKHKSYEPPIQSHLPQEFHKNPKRNMYLALFQKQLSKKPSQNFKLPEIHDKIQYFTIGIPGSQRQQFTYSTIENGRKNIIKVNFKMFQQIFQNTKCELIQNIFSLFLKEEPKQAEELMLLKLNRKMSLKSVRFQSQSLPLRNSNRSIQGVREKFFKQNDISNVRKIDLRSLRSNTQGVVLENILRKSSRQKLRQERKIILDKIQTKSQKNAKLSNRYDDKCSICHKDLRRSAKSRQSKGYILSKDLVDKLSVFRADRSNLQFAHGVLKCQHFSYAPTP